MNDAANCSIKFVMAGQAVSLPESDQQRTLLQYLREDQGLCGTKEGCAEGDCGACTVLLGQLDAHDGTGVIQYKAVNSCIRLLPSVHGKHVVSVEHLHGKSGQLHPAQAAMVACHGSQCGFCTPGFVMSLAAATQPMSREQAMERLSGNLCRCTGYRPILDAAISMHDEQKFAPVAAQDRQWDQAQVSEQLRAIAEQPAPPLTPRSAAQFAQTLLEEPERLVVAGATDVGLWVTKQGRRLPPMLFLGDVAEFHSIEQSPVSLTLHAAVSLEKAWSALVKIYPQWASYAQRFASLPIRNSGTLVGNLANGSPIGDAMPALIAVGARLVLQRGQIQREMPLEDFYLGYRKTALAVGEFVRAVAVPRLASQDWHVAAYKLSKRFDQDISAVALGVALQCNAAGQIQQARLGVGGMAATPLRAKKTEAFLLGKLWTQETLTAAAALLKTEFSPLSDMRASAEYRAQALGNLLVRDWMLMNDQSHDLAQVRAL